MGPKIRYARSGILTIGNGCSSTSITVLNSITSHEYVIPIISSADTGNYPVYAGGNLTFNPATSTLTVSAIVTDLITTSTLYNGIAFHNGTTQIAYISPTLPPTTDNTNTLATTAWVNSVLPLLATREYISQTLPAYATKDYVLETLPAYATTGFLLESLSAYATKEFALSTSSSNLWRPTITIPDLNLQDFYTAYYGSSVTYTTYCGNAVALGNNGSVAAVLSYSSSYNSDSGEQDYLKLISIYSRGSWTSLPVFSIATPFNTKDGCTSIAFSGQGNFLAVGSIYPSQVNVYQNIDNTGFEAYNTPIQGPFSSLFGNSISISADGVYYAIGAPYANENSISQSGGVYIYTPTGAGTWSQVGTTLTLGTISAHSGTCVSLSANGKICAFGAPNYLVGSVNVGAVAVYAYTSSSWVQRGIVLKNNVFPTIKSNFGFSLSLSPTGNTLVVGSYSCPFGTATNAGIILIYQWDGLSSWTMAYFLGNNITNSQFGYSVAFTGDANTCAVAASGLVYTYKFYGKGWYQVGNTITTSNTINSVVAISEDGRQCLVGNTGGAGSIRFFQN